MQNVKLIIVLISVGLAIMTLILTLTNIGLAIMTLSKVSNKSEDNHNIVMILTRVTDKHKRNQMDRVKKKFRNIDEFVTHYYLKVGFNNISKVEVERQDYINISNGDLCLVGITNNKYEFEQKINSIIGSDNYDIEHLITVGIIEDKYILEDKHFLKIREIEQPIEIYASEEEDYNIGDNITLINDGKKIVAGIKIDKQDIGE